MYVISASLLSNNHILLCAVASHCFQDVCNLKQWEAVILRASALVSYKKPVTS